MLLLLVLLVSLAPQAQAASASAKAGTVTTSSTKLNVRAQASSKASVVTSLDRGSHITLIEKSGSWWKVEYAKGKYGYCHIDYITPVSSAAVTIRTSSTGLNVRSGAGTTYRKVAVLPKGETVLFLSVSNGWSKILYHGTKTGYVSAEYLSNYYGAVSLKVPNFKQTDSRWANEIIGDSGKTFQQIGCATTAIAMMESFRTGKNLYPNVISQELRYTPSGDVYWPGHYAVVTSSEGYLETIYNKLRQGRPVLVGARNTYGSQHWVVITGYTGGTSLNPADFVIHDPGTYSRTNLLQFQKAYPTFYKYFYY